MWKVVGGGGGGARLGGAGVGISLYLNSQMFELGPVDTIYSGHNDDEGSPFKERGGGGGIPSREKRELPQPRKFPP